jgi:hypothetical protein
MLHADGHDESDMRIFQTIISEQPQTLSSLSEFYYRVSGLNPEESTCYFDGSETSFERTGRT